MAGSTQGGKPISDERMKGRWRFSRGAYTNNAHSVEDKAHITFDGSLNMTFLHVSS